MNTRSKVYFSACSTVLVLIVRMTVVSINMKHDVTSSIMFPRSAVCFSVFIFTSFFYLNFSEVKISENNRIIVQVCLFFPLSYRNLSIFPDISSCNTGQTVDRGAVRYTSFHAVGGNSFGF